MVNTQLPWEVGSEFHWAGIPEGPFLPWPQPHVFFALGRDTLASIWEMHIKNSSAKKLFVPDYFCSEIVGYWEKRGITVSRYFDNPKLSCPNWDTMVVEPGDIVLAVNYFGVRDGKFWQSWRRANQDVILIEDHSHDPLSKWALNSEADYAFASLRKTFPVPDGAILWSPKNHALPSEPVNRNWMGSSYKLASMILKRDYLLGPEKRVKQVYRNFQAEGEKIYSGSKDLNLSPWSRSLLDAGYPKTWRLQREENVKLMLQYMSRQSSFKPLFTEWPDGHCPFNAVVVFSSNELRERYRERFIKANIYTPIHWRLNALSFADSQDLSERILTIPVDQRYGSEEMRCIAAVMLE